MYAFKKNLSFLLLTLAACHFETVTQPDIAGCEDDSCNLTCSGEETICGSECVALNSDPNHCGGCGIPCEDGDSCQNGTCTPVTCNGPGEYAASVAVTNPGNRKQDYPVRVRLHTARLRDEGKLDDSCHNVRFSLADGTPLTHWRESPCTDLVNTGFWVRIPNLPRGTTTLLAQMGPGGVVDPSDGAATFSFFDDFNNLNNWQARRIDYDSGLDSSSASIVPFIDRSSASLFTSGHCAGPLDDVPTSPGTAIRITTPIRSFSGQHCIDYAVRSGVFDNGFAGPATVTAARAILIGNNVVATSSYDCTPPCAESSDFQDFSHSVPAAGRSVGLESRAGVCADTVQFFDNVRLRRCTPGAEPVATTNTERSCR